MSRKQITISVPETLQRYVEDRVNASGYGTVSEYFRELLREDRQRQINRMNNANRYATERAFPTLGPATGRSK